MTIERYIDMVVRETAKGHIPAICSKIKTGEYGCTACGHIAPKSAFVYGEDKAVARHETHQLCPKCGLSITWHGYVSGDVIARSKTREEVKGTRSVA